MSVAPTAWLSVLLLISATLAPAQELKWEIVRQGIDFENVPGELVSFPFTGGFNSYKFQLVDMDGDGDDDVFQKESEGRLLYYECVSRETMAYTLHTMYYENLDVPNWFRFADVDDDGDQDVFLGNRQGEVTFAKNVGTPIEPVFAEAVKLVDADNASIRGDINSFPSFFDVDCDGDVDLLLGDVAGTVSYYSLLSIDSEGVPVYQLETTRFQDLFIVTGGSAKKPSDIVSHGANAFAFVDIFDNGAPALLWGDYFSSRLLMFDNNGTCGDMQLDTNFSLFPKGAPLQTTGFNAPAVGFINSDATPDIIVGIGGGAVEHSGVVEQPFERVKVYLGSETNPGTFQELSQQLFSTVDVGDRSAPVFVDIDADGDKDLYVGNQAESESGLRSNVYFFRNTGSDEFPEFVLVNTDVVGPVPTTFAKPAFADIDADGDYDLFIGGFNGRLLMYRNLGSAEIPSFSLEDDFYQGLDVGSYAAPILFDEDNDGDLDLLIGNSKGELHFYENTGTSQFATFGEPTVLPIDIGANAVPSLAALSDSTYLLCIGASEADSTSCFVWQDMQLTEVVKPEVSLSYSHPAMYRVGDRVLLLLGTSSGGVVAYLTDVVSNIFEHDAPTEFQVSFASEANHIVIRSSQDVLLTEVDIEAFTIDGRKVPTTKHVVTSNELHLHIQNWIPSLVVVRVGSQYSMLFLQ